VFYQTAILWIMHFIPGLRLKVSEPIETRGIDDSSMGEYAYDYVGIENNVDIESHKHTDNGRDVELKEQRPSTANGTSE
jgi:ammonium transporter, Amt family